MNMQSDVRLEKSIVIPYEEAQKMEAAGVILPSDGYMERDGGERAAPSLVKLQETVDYETAQRLAAQKGVALPGAGAPMTPTIAPGKNIGTSKLPSAILESFKHKPPVAPTMPSTEFNPEFLSKVKEHNNRMNAVLGESGGSRSQYQAEPAVPSRNTEYRPMPAQQATIDYPFLGMVIKEAVREVLAELNIKDVVKEVLNEERAKVTSTKVNENIEIKFGKTVLAGYVQRLDQVKK